MATRKPLVIVNGKMREIASGDTIDSAYISAGSVVPGSVLEIEEDFLEQSLPSRWTAHISGTGSGTSYLNDPAYPGQCYQGPGTGSGAYSGYHCLSPNICSGPTSGMSVANGDITFKVIVKTPSTLFSATEDYRMLYGFNSSFNGFGDYGARIVAQYGVNSGKWYFQYYTTSAQVTIVANTAGAITADTWYVLEFTITGSSHLCTFKVNGVVEGTGTPASKITTSNQSALWLHITKIASAGAHPRPKIDYVYFKQVLSRTA